MCFVFQVGDIAVRYHSCDNNSSSSDASFTSSSTCCQSILLPESSTSVCEMCLSLSRTVLTSSYACSSFSSVSEGGELLQSSLKHCCLQLESVDCSTIMSNYSPFSQYSACCRGIKPHHNESQAKEVPDMQGVPHTPASSPSGSQQGDDITGLWCRTNRTLRFYVLDVALNWPLAVRLGATDNMNASLPQECDGSGDSSFAAIVDLKDEVHYVLHRTPAITLTESLGETVFHSCHMTNTVRLIQGLGLLKPESFSFTLKTMFCFLQGV